MNTTVNNFLDFYRTLPLKEIRRRQDLTFAQIRTAYEQRNDKAIKTLQMMDEALMEALLERC